MPDGLQKAIGGGAAHGIDNQVHVAHDVLGCGLCVIDELVCAEIVQESLVTAGRTGDDARSPVFRQLNREMTNSTRRAIDENGSSLEGNRLVPDWLQRIGLVVPQGDQELPRRQP